ncbi:hypothetical protein [Hymenobacter sp.]|uniref:hypothetical protein n=1 Tax=Hymenobacter sp. TaxID=1898978 RepID=UPI00286ADF0F|nr:hypothetical protein [Hymenobacter sp.]
MAERLPIEELSRQPLVVGTTCFTDPSGNDGFKTEQVQASALVRIAAALESQTDLLRGARAGFDLSQQQDGRNHVHMVQTDNSCVVSIQVLGSSPAMAKQLAKGLGDVLKDLIDFANQELQEGGPDNG